MMKKRGALLAMMGAVLLALTVVAGCSEVFPSGTATTLPGSTTGPGATATTAVTSGLGNATSSTRSVVPPTVVVPSGEGSVSPAVAVAAQVGPSVVNVKVKGVTAGAFGEQPWEGEGSGVVFAAEGMIVTNNHVVSQSNRPAADILVTLATGEELDARIIGRDSLTDLAVVQVNKADLPAAVFVEDMSQVQIGQYAIAIGSPLGFSNSVTLGVVSGLHREIPVSAAEGGQSLIDLVQTDAAISPGNSGGALVDSSGRVIGINVAYLPPDSTGAQDLGFAIPADVAVDVARQLIATGRASHSFLGISPLSVTVELQQRFDLDRDFGILIADVEADTPAGRAGLQQGDIIVGIDGQAMEQESDLYKFLRAKKPGDTVVVSYVRDNSEATTQVRLGERPQ